MNIYFYDIGGKARKKTDDLIKESVIRYARLAEPVDSALFKVERTQNGKPFLSGLPLCVGVSHTNNLAAIAVGKQDFGIDMEHKGRQIKSLDAILKRFCFANERSFVCAAKTQSEKNCRALGVWVKKEAYLKCLGDGLSAISLADTESVSGKFKRVEHKNMLIYVYFANKNADEEIFCID